MGLVLAIPENKCILGLAVNLFPGNASNYGLGLGEDPSETMYIIFKYIYIDIYILGRSPSQQQWPPGDCHFSIREPNKLLNLPVIGRGATKKAFLKYTTYT